MLGVRPMAAYIWRYMVVYNNARLFFCAFGPKLRSHKNSAFRQKTGNFTRNSGKISQKLRYSETFSIAQYIRFFKNSAQAAKTQIKFRKTQLFGNICMFLYQKSEQKKACVLAPILSLASRIIQINIIVCSNRWPSRTNPFCFVYLSDIKIRHCADVVWRDAVSIYRIAVKNIK